MAKTSTTEKNNRKYAQSQARRSLRLALKRLIRKGTDEQREEAQIKLQKCSRNDSPCRVRNRCHYCGRGHATLRKFGMCRLCLREAVMKRGDIPGVRKSSW